MIKNTRFLLLLLLPLIIACFKNKNTLLEQQLGELNKMETRALEIKDSLKNKKGEEYLTAHDSYYDIMIKRANKAVKYLNRADFVNLSMDGLKNLVQIAKIAQNEQKIVDILKMLFNRFPELKADRQFLKLYFPNAYLLEPDEIEKYMDITKFSPDEQLFCYHALALGFCELENFEDAQKYIKKSADLFKNIISNAAHKNIRSVLQIIALRSYIEYMLGHTLEAYKIINDVKKEVAFTGDYAKKQLELYENRLNILGKKAKSIEYQFWVGTEHPVDLSELKGNVILLDFFTWNCEACNTGLPSLFALKEQIKNNFMIVGVTQYTGDQSFTELREYRYIKDQYYNKRKFKWPVSITRNDSMDDYGISSFPAYILIDKDGIIRDGYFISNYSYLKKKIELLIKE